MSALRYVAAALAAAVAPPLSATPLQWQETTIAIDAPALAESVEAVFRFTNTSERPVTIADVHSSCGCTVPQLEKKTYAPGESGSIRAVFTLGERIGLQEKVIMVTTAAPEASSTSLTLRVQIPTLFEVKPYFVIWNVDEAPLPKTVMLRLLAPEVLGFGEVVSRHTGFEVRATPATDDPNLYALAISPHSTAASTNGAIEVTLRAPDGRTRAITLYALIRDGRAPARTSGAGGS